MSRTALSNVLAKLQNSVQSGNFYEAHQMYLSLSQRYLKSRKIDDAIQLVADGAKQLLKHGQIGEGADLGNKLCDVYAEHGIPVTNESRDRITALIPYFPPTSTQFPTFVARAIKWTSSSKENTSTSTPAGDQELHTQFALHYASSSLYYDAEIHFFYGTQEASKALAAMYSKWCSEDSTVDKGYLALRGVLSYLALDRIASANLFLNTFVSSLGLKESTKLPFLNTGFPVYGVDGIDIARLLEIVVSRDGTYNEFLSLRSKIEQYGDKSFDKLLDVIAQTSFDIKPSKPNNVLADLMGSLFGGQ